MATAAKLTLVPPPELSVAEELAHMSGEEILAASQETSKKFNGIVLSKAVLIVQCRVKCLSLSELAKRACVGKNAMYRFARGGPCGNTTLRRALRDLACFLEEQCP